MADDKKTYSEDEHLAILADRVTKETASLTAERDQLVADKTAAQTALDVAESAKIAAEQKATEATQALEDYKSEVEGEREAAARKDTRVTEVKDKATHLADDWFTEDRVKRITAMSDEDFTSYVSDLSDGAPKGADGKPIPRETAMQGQPVDDGKPKTGAGRSFLMRNYENQEV